MPRWSGRTRRICRRRRNSNARDCGSTGFHASDCHPTGRSSIQISISSGPALGSELTSLVYFDESVTDRVFARAPYAAHAGRSRTKNSEDGLYRRGGDRLLLALAESGGGYASEFHLGMRMT